MNTKRNIYKDVEHPFAQYIRIIGKGKNGARSLTYDEAYHAFSMIEPYRVCRRPTFLRECPNDKTKIYP